MDKNYLTTGEFAKLCHTSKDTLFHYCDIGLFSPAWTNENGYRYYHVLQYDSFITIRQLHLMGMPLAEIKKYMAERTPQNMVTLFRDREDFLDQQIAQLKRLKTQLHCQRVSVEEALSHDENQCFVIWQDCRHLLCSNEINEVDDYVMTEEIGSLISAAGNKIQSNTLGMLCDFQETIQGETFPCRFYVCMEDGKSKNTIPMPSGEYLCTYHRGSYETLYRAYRRLYDDAEAQNLSLSDSVYTETVIGDWAVKSPQQYVMKVFAKIC